MSHQPAPKVRQVARPIDVSTVSTRHSAGPLAAPSRQVPSPTNPEQSKSKIEANELKMTKKRFGAGAPCDRTASFPCRHEANPTLQAFWSGPVRRR